MSTIFTKIIDGQLPGNFVWKDKECVVFSTIDPCAPGHMLVVPRLEIDSFTQAPPELFAHLMNVAQIIGDAQLEAFNAVRSGVIIAGFDVPHLHIHVIPAQDQTQLNLANSTPMTLEEIANAAANLRQVLTARGYQQATF